jgi:hypothetical protein
VFDGHRAYVAAGDAPVQASPFGPVPQPPRHVAAATRHVEDAQARQTQPRLQLAQGLPVRFFRAAKGVEAGQTGQGVRMAARAQIGLIHDLRPASALAKKGHDTVAPDGKDNDLTLSV